MKRNLPAAEMCASCWFQAVINAAAKTASDVATHLDLLDQLAVITFLADAARVQIVLEDHESVFLANLTTATKGQAAHCRKGTVAEYVKEWSAAVRRRGAEDASALGKHFPSTN